MAETNDERFHRRQRELRACRCAECRAHYEAERRPVFTYSPLEDFGLTSVQMATFTAIALGEPDHPCVLRDTPGGRCCSVCGRFDSP